MDKRFILFLFFSLTTIALFPQQDSLFDGWNKRLDGINFSNIDRLPIYRFTLNEIRDEIKQYAALEDVDKEKLSDLRWKINYISNLLEQKLARIDRLFFEKALLFEQQGNEQEAIFYYKRSLDFNPSFCLSVEKLSFIYAKNGQNKLHIELFAFLSLYNQLKECDLKIFNAVFDSLIARSNRLIEQRNYYDALEVLDTTKQFLDYVPQEKYLRKYPILLELAQNGIYASYYNIIDKAINIYQLSLAKEYISGLVHVIEKNNHLQSQNLFLTVAIQNLIFAHRSIAEMDLERKQYDKTIEATDSMCLFFNSINYSYPEDLFFDIYSAAYTARYFNMLKNKDPFAEQFYQKHKSYIIIEK